MVYFYRMHETSSKITTIGSIIIIIIAIVLFGLIISYPAPSSEQLSFEENVSQNNQLETFPVNPETFTVSVNQNETVNAEQVINGSVPGFWFFEGSFPVDLVDANNVVFATVLATSSEDWMTSNIIPFTITLPETLSYTGPGKIVFTRDDPSGGESSIPVSETTATILVTFQ